MHRRKCLVLGQSTWRYTHVHTRITAFGAIGFITGVLLHYADGSRAVVGQVRLDRVGEKQRFHAI
jgi:hypothetical protein